jgi:hypothetical protein
MNVVDAIVLALLAVADVALMVHLRRARGRRLRAERVMRSLRLALQREANGEASSPLATPWALRRAS